MIADIISVILKTPYEQSKYVMNPHLWPFSQCILINIFVHMYYFNTTLCLCTIYGYWGQVNSFKNIKLQIQQQVDIELLGN